MEKHNDPICFENDENRNEILPLFGENYFTGMQIAAYDGPSPHCCYPDDCVIDWYGQTPVCGAQIEIGVKYPFCCRIGDEFGAVYNPDPVSRSSLGFQIVCCQLLSVVSADYHTGRILIEITNILGMTALVKPVSDEVREEFQRFHTYIDDANTSWPYREYEFHENLVVVRGNDGVGDRYTDLTAEFYYIYTDPDGFDHLVATGHVDYGITYTFLGDEVLGLHTDSLYLSPLIGEGRCRSLTIFLKNHGQHPPVDCFPKNADIHWFE